MIRPTHADDVLAQKSEEWANQLIQLDGRNSLLNFKITKTTALDLAESTESGLAQLFSGKPTRLAQLFDDPDHYRDACTRTRNLIRKIRGFSEEQGVDVGRLVFGRVTTTASKSGARQQLALRAPLLLFQVTIRSRTAAESDFLLEVDPEPEVNPVLAHCLDREYGVHIDRDDLYGTVVGGTYSNDPETLAEAAFRRIADPSGAQGVQLGFEPMVSIGICNYMKLPMVEDLMSAAPILAQHDLIAMLAGVQPPDATRTEAAYEPAPPDTVPPRQDFLVLDADSSQHRAITTVLADHHTIIDGPPGTGKSQTIANIIAVGAAHGKKILFVAEKRAAIEAVTDRLTDIGLGDLVLDMHQSSLSSRAVATQLATSLDQLARTPAVDGEELDRELADYRKRLNDYTIAMHERREPWQLSAYQVREKILAGAGGIETPLRLRNLEQFTPEGRALAEDDLRAFVANGGLRLVRQESPWWQAGVATVEDARRVLELLDDVAARTLPDSQSQMRALIHQVGLPEPTDFRGWDRTFALLSSMSDTVVKLGPQIFRGPLNEYRVATAQWKQRRTLQPKIGWRKRSALLRELRDNPAGMTHKQLLHEEIVTALEAMQEWDRLSGRPGGPDVIGDIGAVSSRYSMLKGQLAAIAMSAGVNFEQRPLHGVDHEVGALAADRRMVPYLPDLNQRLHRLREAGLEPLVQEVATRDLDAEQSVSLFRRALMSTLEEQFMLTSQPLRDFQPESHSTVAARFRESDMRHQALAVRRVLRTVARNAAQACSDFPDESTLVRSEGKKKRGHRPVRRLVAEAPHVMLAARPCWAMSPLIVSRSLPAQRLFDIVIFDEASQVQPHDAITSIMRGKRLVVAGDDKQLPPTSFFDRLAADDGNEDDDDGVALRDYESILTALQPMIPNRHRLQWHYRSQDERLIQFSNEEVYDNDLVSFPGARVDTPIRLDVVDGRVRPGEQGSAAEEVHHVVDLVIEHAEKRPHESLGVITLGSPHQKKIDMAIRQRRTERPDLDQFFADDRGATKRFFVKNIETVQGDERDAIILSVGVAKDANGKVRGHGFAVLNREGTERRVNVAVTRAKRRMTVVSSFPPGALAPSEKMTGTELLRRYLEAAARGGKTEAVGRREAFSLNAFERAIADGLDAIGITAYPQWGVSDYRIDFALAHPDEPGRMVLAVEADGDSYHRTYSARDRDRLRQQHLERLGWRFHRVWASAWFADSGTELDRIHRAWVDAVSLADAEPAVEIPSAPQPTTLSDNDIHPKLPRPSVTPRLPIDKYAPGELVAMFRWRMSDGLLLDPEERTRQVREDLGFKRRGRRIDESLRNALEEAQRLQDQEEW